MGPYVVPSSQGFVILNRFGQIWDRSFYKDEESARKALSAHGFCEDENFKIVPAHLEIDKAEITPEIERTD